MADFQKYLLRLICKINNNRYLAYNYSCLLNLYMIYISILEKFICLVNLKNKKMLAHWHLLTEKLKNIQNSLCTLKFLLSWNRQEFRDLEISRWVGVITWAMIAHLHFDFWIPSSINLHISVLYKTSHPPNLRRLTILFSYSQHGSTEHANINLIGKHHTHISH